MSDKIIVVDIDGVLCDLVESSIPVINNKFNCDLKRNDIKMFEMDRIVGIKKDEFDKIFQLLDYSKMRPIEGAVQGLRKLANYFHIAIATSRPKNIHELTKQWLNDNGFIYHSFMAHQVANSLAKKKSDLFIGADVVIDDDIREIITASSLAKVTCLFDSPWNHSINAKNLFYRCHNWDEIIKACMGIL